LTSGLRYDWFCRPRGHTIGPNPWNAPGWRPGGAGAMPVPPSWPSGASGARRIDPYSRSSTITGGPAWPTARISAGQKPGACAPRANSRGIWAGWTRSRGPRWVFLPPPRGSTPILAYPRCWTM